MHLADVTTPDFRQLQDEYGDWLSGVYSRFNGTIVMADRGPSGAPPTPDEFLTVIMHEFGHALGLKHSGDGLMSGHGASSHCIDAMLVAQLCERNDCGPRAGPVGC